MNKDKMSFMEKIDFIMQHFGISDTEGKEESVRQWLHKKQLDDEDLTCLLEAHEKFILSNVIKSVCEHNYYDADQDFIASQCVKCGEPK